MIFAWQVGSGWRGIGWLLVLLAGYLYAIYWIVGLIWFAKGAVLNINSLGRLDTAESKMSMWCITPDSRPARSGTCGGKWEAKWFLSVFCQSVVITTRDFVISFWWRKVSSQYFGEPPMVMTSSKCLFMKCAVLLLLFLGLWLPACGKSSSPIIRLGWVAYLGSGF